MVAVNNLENLFEPTRNCHRLAPARRVAFIVDGEAYFRALYECFRQARHSIFIVGWDLHSDLQLLREKTEDEYPRRLGELLDRRVAEKEDLHVYLLSWDFAMIYSLEREFFPRYKLKWRTHRRVHFCLDGQHPVGASQHQKIVVIDDSVAFAGGLDLSQWRWDTPDHAPDDERRVDPGGKPYAPFHDVQMAVDGPAAEALGLLARERWSFAGGRTPIDPRRIDEDAPWPSSIEPDLAHVQVAIARTMPAYKGRRAVREVERLYLDSIASAKRFIYLENQYLSSHRVGQALGKCLEMADGPELVIVLPEKTGGWLEQHTMDVLRGRVLQRLRAADRHARLRIYYPRLASDPHCALMVHAKVMVIDDDIVRIGSSNLSNRSMGLDSECDLAIAAGSDETIRSAIARFRNRLLAEHLDTDPDLVAQTIEKTESLIEAVESLGGKERTLATLSGNVPPEVDEWVPESKLLDPEKPVEPDELIDHFVRPEQQPLAYRHLLRVFVLVAGVLALAAVWRWTPVNEWVDVASVKNAGEWVRRQPLTPLLVMAGYVLGGLVAFPVTLMVIATVLVFGPWWGTLYALTGSELSALAVFWAGRLLGRDIVRRFAGSLLNRISRRLSDSGLITVITFRIVPVAPFSVINLVAGVSEIRWRDFALGTFVGTVPGVLIIVLLADRIAESLRSPDIGQFAALGVTVLAVTAGLVGLRLWIKGQRGRRSSRKVA
jgi:phosphatidylserine/phosphatidylglycerophosphate/cardiolipin synthase-like enzyme/membrane protein DedA with SNARE-associated domain